METPRRLLSTWGVVVSLVGGLFAGCDFLNLGPGTLAIERFAATPNPISPGGASLLSWEVDGADAVQIDNGIGVVPAKGVREVKPAYTTTYNLVARAETTTATASIQVVVTGTSGPPPSPAPLPTATPAPTATPIPGPTATPGPTPTRTPTPSPTPTLPPGTKTPTPTPTPTSTPTPTPTPVSCGAPAGPTMGCAVTITKPTSLPSSQCIELTQVSASRPCPVGPGVTRAVSFQITAKTNRGSLQWRRGNPSNDSLSPSSGSIDPNAATTVALQQTVLGSSLVIEIMDGSTPLLRFTLQNDF